MKQGWSLLLTALCAAVILVWTGHIAFSAESPLADKTTTTVGLRKTNAASSSSSTAKTFNEDSEQAVRRLIADVDEAALARYKADTPGFRRHPSYYSDKYLTRARGPDASMGSWTLVDSKSAIRPGDDFYNQYPNRDVPWQDFPETTAWQKDATYLPQFLDQGIALVERALEAILTEYGYGSDRDDRPFEERLSILTNPSRNTMPGKSFEGLVRRVLHSIVTQDTFTLAMSGHSAAAGTCAKTNVFVQCLCVFYSLFIHWFIHSFFACSLPLVVVSRPWQSLSTILHSCLRGYCGAHLCSSRCTRHVSELWFWRIGYHSNRNSSLGVDGAGRGRANVGFRYDGKGFCHWCLGSSGSVGRRSHPCLPEHGCLWKSSQFRSRHGCRVAG